MFAVQIADEVRRAQIETARRFLHVVRKDVGARTISSCRRRIPRELVN